MFCLKNGCTMSVEKGDDISSLEDNMYLMNGKESPKRTVKNNFRRSFSLMLKKKSQSPSSIQNGKIESSPIPTIICSENDEMNQTEDVSLQQQAAAIAAAQAVLTSTPCSSRSRQKKFHKYFNEVPSDEKVINYYSCSLVRDTSVHGNIYITKNYIAFYSSASGKIIKISIPTSSILNITKEKISSNKLNVISVFTVKEKYLFRSFLKRDACYKLMVQVWTSAIKYLNIPSQTLSRNTSPSMNSFLMEGNRTEDNSSLSESESNAAIISEPVSSFSNNCDEQQNRSDILPSKQEVKLNENIGSSNIDYVSIYSNWLQNVFNLPKNRYFLHASAICTALLLTSAAFLLYRISVLKEQYSENHYLDSIRSLNDFHEFLHLNLNYFSKVRKSLQILSKFIDQDIPFNLSNRVILESV